MTAADAPHDTTVAGAKNRLLRHIGKLLELNTNIELNLSDAAFAADGKTILHVFDETVFETFIAPRHRRLAIASHFADGSPQQLAPPFNWDKYETQSTLIAMEYLFDGAQSRSPSEDIFITYWHEIERASRVDALLQSYSQRARQGQTALNAEEARQVALKAAYAGDTLPEGWQIPGDLRHDMDALEAEARRNGQTIDLSRFAFTREAAALISDSPVLEPLQQLQRIVSDRFEKRLKILSQAVLKDRFGFSGSDFDDLAAETYKWVFRIQDELNLHGRHREPGSVKSDAQSLALLCRLSAKLAESDQRLVFVTTDSIIYDAYRRWDCQLTPEQKSFYDPFMVRHAVQYLPLINLINGGSDLSHASASGRQRVSQLFDMISEAVEICLLPFNISNLGGADPTALGRTSRRSREDLSLRLSQDRSAGPDQVLQFFLKHQSSDWYEQSRASIEAIRQAWQEVERIAIGTFHDLVQKRLNDDERIISSLPLDAGSSEQMTNYLFNALDQLLQRSVNVWIPLARTAIDDLMHREPGVRGRQRAPFTVWGETSDGQSLSAIIRRHGSTHGITVPDAPHDVFMVAAALAIALRDWSQAERFAGLAERALASRNGEDDLLVLDARFIHCLAQRFSLGQISGHLGSAALNSASYVQSGLRHLAQIHTRVSQSLHGLIAVHERLKDDPQHYVRLIRAHSELAALSLFTYASLSAARLNGHVCKAEITEARALEDTRTHLMECLALDRAAAGRRTLAAVRNKLSAVRSQYQSNLACMEAERHAFGGGTPFVPDEGIGALKAEIKTRYDKFKGTLSAIANLEIAAFLLLYGEGSAEYKSSILMYRDELKGSDMSLDAFVANAVTNGAIHMA